MPDGIMLYEKIIGLAITASFLILYAAPTSAARFCHCKKQEIQAPSPANDDAPADPDAQFDASEAVPHEGGVLPPITLSEYEKLPVVLADSDPNPDREDRFLENPIEKSVRVVWLIPTDAEHDAASEKLIADAMRKTQQYFKEQLNGKTFALNDPVVEIMYSNEDSDYYAETNPYGMTDAEAEATAEKLEWGNFYKVANVQLNGHLALMGRRDDISGYKWVLFTGVEQTNQPITLAPFGKKMDSVVSLFGKNDIEALQSGATKAITEAVIAHEIGHGFYVDHTTDSGSIMQGVAHYDLKKHDFLESEKNVILTDPKNRGYVK